MGSWNGMTYEGKDTLLRVVRHEAEDFYALAEQPGVWEAPTGCAEWQVRDLVGHLVDVTENYFERFDAARGGLEVEPAYGVRGMAERAGERGRSFRDVTQAELVERGRTDFAKMMGLLEALTPEDWTGLNVSHYYMGRLPAHFYAAFQLMDYGVHTWDIREGSGREHALSGEVADLLVPYMFVLWSATAAPDPEATPFEIGIRITGGANAGDTRVSVGPDGLTYAAGDLADLTVLEFDAGSFVLTAFGRCHGGTVRGDREVADRFLNLFFRI
ncbi:maleylpyruvate isomerase family mycothiol-dependent enzyme [Oryzihumus sp.]